MLRFRGPHLRWPTRAPTRRLLSTPPPVTVVEKIIMDGIKATGPISFSTYMQMCLSHPTAGYYMNPKNPIFGSKGDFVTSPEITSLFGELLGVWLMSQWMQGPQLPIRIVELGPGRGTLMQDVVRVVARFGKDKLKSVHLVETSPTLRALQEARLEPEAGKYNCTLGWHDSIGDIAPSAEEYTMVVAHEFFDALPFHTIQKTEQGWQEILIALAESSEETYPRFRYVLSPQASAASTLLGFSSSRFKDMPVGSRIEVSPIAFKTMHAIGELIQGNSTESLGCGLVVDYGADRAFDQSFRAFKKHEIADIFHEPGECDLTVNVDFAYLREAVGDFGPAVPTHGPISQAAFLEGMGLSMRVEAAAQRSEDGGVAIREAAKRLVDPSGMGEEYKVLGIGGHASGAVWPFVPETGA
ncbi:S-adenosyl-L-methionine-dependent methyltransferase [Roridomyces roridus]|uniref:Protein arginine methyltransferase NDUFAF7 n=1 Tax=Roridomyces roridus TaxID=1738132 RepID=A0AAD7C5I9_9AGAR|nr:S-adenosyl-L-methionine-dependent methyltransferase [Roridomyces roridus]